jgi:hypothetical protein
MSDTSTSVTRAITGRHARGIRNPLMRRLSETMDKIAPYPVQNALTQELRQSASRAQNGDYLSLWSGQGAPLGRARREGLGADELVAQIEQEMACRDGTDRRARTLNRHHHGLVFQAVATRPLFSTRRFESLMVLPAKSVEPHFLEQSLT